MIEISSLSRVSGVWRAAGVGVFLAAAMPGASEAADAQRIVSIGGAATEILYRMGAQDRVVAVDTTSLYPDEATRKPNIGYIRAISPEGVLSTSPDLIIMEDGAGPPDAVALLDKAGIPIVHVPAGHDLDALGKKIRAVADAVGKNYDGERLALQVEADLQKLKADLAAVTKSKRVLFVMSMTEGRPLAAGTHTGADSIIGLAGAENVFKDAKGYKTISPEAATALQPDFILMMSRGGGPEVTAEVLKSPAFVETPAGKTGGFIKMDGLYLLGFGPRTPEAARELAAQLYPELKLSEKK